MIIRNFKLIFATLANALWAVAEWMDVTRITLKSTFLSLIWHAAHGNRGGEQQGTVGITVICDAGVICRYARVSTEAQDLSGQLAQR